ncbi:MAG TPA: porin [Phycisphaerae bacterium]|nr:porin [Phycisphaerae bacterium]
MYLHDKRLSVAAAATLLVLTAGRSALADDKDNAELLSRIQQLSNRVEELEKQQDQNWMTQERTNQIRAIVDQAIADAKKRDAASSLAGYNNGFYIQSADQNFKLNVNGVMQLRYTFAKDTLQDPSAYAKKPASGDVNGFDIRRARLIFSGNAFSPDVTYCLSGDFCGDYAEKTDQGFFQLQDAYICYRFNDALKLRVGSFVVPFSRAEYTYAGLQLVDFPAELPPFDPVRAIGASVLGQPIPDRLSYEVNMNNGQKSNILGRASEIAAGANDNRLAFYSRLQYAGAGHLSDFLDEPDLRKDTSSLAWQIGAAAGYESANTSANAFPSPQGSATVPGLSTIQSPGFASTYTLNGDLYRATIDATAKYRGLSLLSAAYFQQVNENPGEGVKPSISPSSFFQTGFYGQAGYMLNKHWEIVARAGDLLTEGADNQMQTYALGINYYLYGQNLKVQSDVTYIPNEAAYTNSCIDTAINTQDLIFRMQVQLKF